MWNFVFYILGLAVFLFFLLCIFLVFTTKPYPMKFNYKEEGQYWDPKDKQSLNFSTIDEPASVFLTVVVPAYNEEERVPSMLDEALQYLEQQRNNKPDFTYEVIVVSDGSTDGTVKVVHSYCERYGVEKIKCLELVKNRGKGGAVRLGIERSRGAVVLFADADGATKFEDLSKLERALEAEVGRSVISDLAALSRSHAIVIGSRAHLEKESLATRSIFRNILMYGFHFLVWLFTVRDIRDTQCGFKLFTRNSAKVCFDSLHVERWAFDVELLFIAQKLNIPISEVSVRWTEIEGSKVTPVWSWIQMGVDLGLIWLRYTLGAWKLRTVKLD